MPAVLNQDARGSMQGSVLVTGGLGAIGQLTGQWVAAASTCAHVWMLGRSGRAPDSQAGAVFRHGGLISTAACDAAAQADVHGLTQLMACSGAAAVSALLHASGVLRDAVLGRQTADGVRATFAPKVPGTLCMLSATGAHPMAAAALFSSLAALLGSAGQANYAAANTALDGLAEEWQRRGVRSCSVQWGPWASGMALSDPRIMLRLEKAGMGTITGARTRAVRAAHLLLRALPQRWRGHPFCPALTCTGSVGMELLQGALGGVILAAGPVLVAAHILWPSLLRVMPDVPGVFAAFAPSQPSTAQPSAHEVASHPKEAAASAAAVRLAVMEAVAGLLGADVPADQPLMEAGLDSLGT